MDEVLTASATEQARLIRARQIGSVELVEAHLAQIERTDATIHAVAELLADRALAEARTADSSELRGPFHGVPFSIKDSIELAGTVCTAGTVGRRGAPASTQDAVLVARLRAAGAIPMARTNLPDLLFAFETDNLLFGRTNNPYDPARTPGGSSGGEAALIAACGSPMGLGSDCAGSVRVPAAFCGIASLKPTSGCLPRRGHFPPEGGWISALWQIGPMARRVEDLQTMMRVMALEPPFGGPAVAQPRIAFYADDAREDVAGVVRAAAAALGAVEDRPCCLDGAYDLEMKLLGADGGDSLRAYLASLGSTELHPLLTGWLDKLEAYRTDLAGLQAYWADWDRYRARMADFLLRYDAIVCPVYKEPALLHGTSIEEANFRSFSHTMAYNLAGLPAAVVRCGESAEGLPIAVQVVARPWRDDVALMLAARLEREFGGWKPSRRADGWFLPSAGPDRPQKAMVCPTGMEGA
ncbi:MAG TPA: amidase [Bryobacteraceae bacterium]|nr:amidase [Bryobacteraceae bacterium]